MHFLKIIEWSLGTLTRKMLENHVFWRLILFNTHLLLFLQPSVLWLSVVTSVNNGARPKWFLHELDVSRIRPRLGGLTDLETFTLKEITILFSTHWQKLWKSGEEDWQTVSRNSSRIKASRKTQGRLLLSYNWMRISFRDFQSFTGFFQKRRSLWGLGGFLINFVCLYVAQKTTPARS